MPAELNAERAVEVICDRGPREQPRYSVGSGYLIGGPLVLSAAHVLDVTTVSCASG